MNEETGYAINKQVAEALGYRVDDAPVSVAGFDRPFVTLRDPNGKSVTKALLEDVWRRAMWAGLFNWSTDLSAAMSFVRQLAPDAVIEFAPRTANIEVNARESYFSGKGETDAERLCNAGLKLAAALKKKETVSDGS